MNITLSPSLSELLDRLKEETSLNQSEIRRRDIVATDSDSSVLEIIEKPGRLGRLLNWIGAPAESWVDCLPLLKRLKGWGGDDHGPFVERVLQRLAQPDASAAITSGLDSADRTTRRL